MYKSIKYRIYPNNKQVEIIKQTFGCCRKIWNLILEDKLRSIEDNKCTKNKLLCDYLKEYPYLNDVEFSALSNVKKNLLTIIKTTYKDKGLPKFKSNKYGRKSYTVNNSGCKIVVSNGSIKLPFLEDVKAEIHRRPNESHVIIFATVSKECDETYYCSITYKCFSMPPKITLDTNSSVGLDYCSNGLYIDDKGNAGTNHKNYKESQNKLARLQRKLAKKQGYRKGERKSKNYQKQLLKVNKLHCHIKNQRNDNLHKLSNEIANHYDIVCVENLDMISISKHPMLGKNTMDNGYGLFLRYLEYKLNNRGKKLIRVDKYFPSSQKCNHCGHINSELKDLNIREWTCPVCGTSHNRDINAAINIKNEGLRLYSLHLNTITVG